MTKDMLAILMVAIPLAAFGLSFFTRNRLAFWLLRIAGLTFAVSLSLMIIADNNCSGDLLNGLSNCAAGLTGPLNALAPILLLLFMSYLYFGPVILLVSLGLEIYTRVTRR
ncbi:hypothetical protein PSM7751_01304 [Pseudooceanicola marinus]|uniref:Uncharacterized protein n=1 Tax=Pseudooceanicola marinus TaxID=396013 RepID=A0A1X6YTV9_9RHOB|nr:hypothetical protein [Pseudooceanicola marinus]PJE26175.1 hypothetical protein CVM50_20095 [Pseudooceanicola marinus]SLN30510.1 hypothetical protein PSM7751_01304 [Pseudooceanicola marinus]